MAMEDCALKESIPHLMGLYNYLCDLSVYSRGWPASSLTSHSSICIYPLSALRQTSFLLRIHAVACFARQSCSLHSFEVAFQDGFGSKTGPKGLAAGLGPVARR